MSHGNDNLLSLVEKYGSPLYVYDANKIIDKYREFLRVFDIPDLKVYYACKALSSMAVLKLFKKLGAGLDCVSIQEIELGIEAGFKPEEILFTPNSISEAEYRKAIEVGVKINVDNLNILEYIGLEYPGLPICVRINPHMMAGGNPKISVGHIDSKFGISIHQLPLLKRLVHNLKIPVEGIHVHTGSDILDSDIFIRAAKIILEVASQFETVKYIDFGSGFKVAYQANDLVTDMNTFGRKFSRLIRDFSELTGKSYTLQFEPGKYLVSESGSFLAQVNTVKQTTSCVFVGIDSGFNHLIRPMFYGAYHDIENLSNPDGNQKIYNVVGYICESDTFAVDRRIREVRKGDILRFKNAGAYCFSMSSNYNSRLKPAEVMLLDGKDYLIRKRETLADLTRNQIVPNLPFFSDSE